MIARHSLQRLISDFQWLVVTANVLAFVFSIVGFLEFEHLLLDLPSHFRIQYFVIALISIPILIYIKRYKTVLLCLLTLASNFYAFSPYISLIRSTPDEHGRKIRVLLANVNSKNERYADVLNMFRRVNPDFLVILELSREWETQLQSLTDILPFKIVKARADNFGIGIYGKHQFANADIMPLDLDQPPTAMIHTKVDGMNLFLVGTHPVPPVSSKNYRSRNKHLRLLADQVIKESGNVIVLGDFNTTMWTPVYRRFVERTSFLEARADNGLIPTWPAQFPLLSVPIDHCLVSSGWRIADMFRENISGSDHDALVADLAPALPESRVEAVDLGN